MKDEKGHGSDSRTGGAAPAHQSDIAKIFAVGTPL